MGGALIVQRGRVCSWPRRCLRVWRHRRCLRVLRHRRWLRVLRHRRCLTCSVREGLQLVAASSSCLKRESLKEPLGVEGLQPVGVAN